MRHHSLALTAVCLLSLGGLAVAQEADEPVPPEVAQAEPPAAPAIDGSAGSYQTVVTAGRSRQSRFEAARSIDVVTRDRIAEAQVRSVPETVEEVPGVLLQQTNRGAGSPIIRGLVGPQNLILVDGIPMTTSTHRTGPNQYLTLVDPFAVRRIEIVRGPSSVLHGSGAMGGVMQILTVDPRLTAGSTAIGGEARSTVSSADLTRGLGLRTEPRAGKVAGLVSGHFDWFDTLRAGEGTDQPLSDYRVGYWQAKASVEPRPGWLLTAAYLGAMLRDSGRTDSAGKGDLRFYDNDDHLTYLVAAGSGPGALRDVTARVYYHQLAERMDRFRCAVTDGVVNDLAACFRLDPGQLTAEHRYDDIVHVVGGDLAAEITVVPRRLVLQAGVEARQELIGSEQQVATAASGWVFEPARGNFSDGSRYLSLGAFAHGEARLVALAPALGRLQLTAGGRLTHIAAFAPEVEGFGDVAYDDQGVVGSVGVQLVRPGRHNVYASFVQGFRPPNLQETTALGDTGQKYAVPNPDLAPEKSNTVEAGSKLVLGRLEIDLAAFYSRNTDAIVWGATTWEGQTEIDGKPVIHTVNAQRGVFVGAEGALALRLWRLTLSAAASWIRGDVELVDGTEVPAQRVPPAFGSTAVRYDHRGRRFFVETFVRWAATQDRLNPEDEKDLRICETSPFSGTLQDPCDGTPGYVTLNLRGAWRIDSRFTAYLLLANLTDERYRTHGSGFDAPGLDARLTLQAEF